MIGISFNRFSFSFRTDFKFFSIFTLSVDRYFGGKRITVTDTGKGIPDANKGVIFEPFYTTKGRGVGTGLGLPISLKLAKAMGGDIKLLPTEKGTSFELSLPDEKKMAQ